MECTAISYILIFNNSEKICSFLTVFLLSFAYSFYSMTNDSPVAEFIVPDWGDTVDPGIGLSYRPIMLHRLSGRNDNPIRNQLYPLFRDYEFGYSSFVHSPLSPLPLPLPLPRPQPQKNKLLRGPETHTKRQGTQHDCPSQLAGRWGQRN